MNQWMWGGNILYCWVTSDHSEQSKGGENGGQVTTDMKERNSTVSHVILLQVQLLPTLLHEEILIEEIAA